MDSIKIQFNTLIFKMLVLVSIFITMIFTKTNAQNNTDSVNAKTLYDSAKIYYRNTNYKEAKLYFNNVLLIKDKIPNDINPEYFYIYNWLGLINKKQGNLQKAISYYKYALEKTHENYYKALINVNVANIYSLTGDYSKAISYFENILLILEKSDEKRKFSNIVDNCHNLAYAYDKLGEYTLAKDNYLKSIQVAKENQLGENGDTYYNCGWVYKKLGKFDTAESYFKKAIKCCIKDYGENNYMTAMAYTNYADFYVAICDYENSYRLYEKSLEILVHSLGQKHLYTSLCLKNIGQLHDQRKYYRLALNYYQKSLISKIHNFNNSSIYSNPKSDVLPDMDLLGILKAKAHALEKLAQEESKEVNLKAALSTLKFTVDFIEQLRTGYLYESSKLRLAASEHETYLSIIRIAYSLYKSSGDKTYAEIAFKYAEASKYAVLRELKNEEMAKGIASVPDSISNKEREIKEQIGGLRLLIEEESKLENPDSLKIEQQNKKIFGLTQELENLVEELEENYPAYYKQKYNNEVTELESLQKAIGKKDAILEYVLADSALYTFTITCDTFLLLKQNADSSFYSNLDLFNAILHSEYSTDYNMYRSSAYGLYQKLILPVEHLLKNKNLLIIPDDKMSLISFEVLIDNPGTNNSFDYRKESYLLKKYPIAYAYSATLYKNTLSASPVKSAKFLGIAPDYHNSRDSLRHIPLGSENVRKTAWLTLGKSLRDNKATEKEVKKYSSNYDIIHFYAHGYEDTLNPANSKLFLATPEDSVEDGYLYAWEVYNMQLNAKLVSLASCYSGSGQLSKGEGVLSISRSFIFAGSESVIMSLWIASHKPTNEILNSFYLNLLKGMRKDEALQLAKLKYLEETNPILAHPRFWAGIVINGNQNKLYNNWYINKLIFVIGVILLIGIMYFILKKRKSNTEISG